MNDLRLLLAAAVIAGACSSTVDSAMRGATRDDAGTADGATAATDGATADDAATPVTDSGTVATDAPPRFDPNAPCVSGTTWTRGNRGSTQMNPGMACINCHTTMRDGPLYSVAGTAFYAPHEQDRCNGYSGDPPGSLQGVATVHIVDANGVELRLAPNGVGNFYSTRALAFPLRTVEVIGPTGMVRAMGSEAPNGDCNSCHTQTGTDTPTGMAPGRIVVPL